MSAVPSNAHRLVLHTQGALASIAFIDAVVWAAAAALAVWGLGQVVTQIVPFNGGAVPRSGLIALALIAGGGALGASLWRARSIRSAQRVALWIEERLPQLKYALVTRIEPQYARHPLQGALEAAIARAGSPRPALWRAARRTLRGALAALVIAVLAVLALSFIPASWYASMRAQLMSATSVATTAALPSAPSRLSGLTANLTPPSYTGWAPVSLSDPETIAGLVGSEVVVRGAGGADNAGEQNDSHDDKPIEPISATLSGPSLEERPVTVNHSQGPWTLSFTLPDSPAVLTLTDRTYRRILVLEPTADEAPVVKLKTPATDATLKTVRGSLALLAELRDDVGLASAHFEYIVASGSGEGDYQFRSGRLSAQRFATATPDGELEFTVPYADFELQPGDHLSVRAVAMDGNTLSGPGIGYSETRIIRVYRRKEFAEVDVAPAPSVIDSAMTLRMLIKKTEELDGRRASLPRKQFIDEALPLAAHATTIHAKVKGFVDQQSMGGAFDVSPLLTEALAAIWEGSVALGVAETGNALPPLRRAYEALKKLNNAAKYYIRGQAPSVSVDIDKVRMSGMDPVSAGARGARTESPQVRERLHAQYVQALQQFPTAPDEAIESLTLLRVQALEDLPDLAPVLERLIEALKAGGETHALRQQARQILERRPQVHPAERWSPLS